MKTRFLLVILLVAFANCKTARPIYDSDNLAGKYSPEDGGYTRLILNSNSAFLYHRLPDGHMAPDLASSDTIAYGTWRLDEKGWLAVSSPPKLLKKLTITVEECSNSNTDTVYLRINSPFQENLSNHRFEPTIAVYAVSVLVMDAFLEQLNPSSTSNVIKLYNPKRLPILSMGLVIYPEPHYFDNNIFGKYNEGFKAGLTQLYSVKNPASNQFVINIPGLTEGYLNHRRLNQDYIKVIDKNHLKWDGHIFKKDVPKSENTSSPQTNYSIR